MRIKVLLSSMIVVGMLSGCMDNNYDLSDIDGTVQLEVKDYVLPVCIKNMTLKKVLDINEDGQIKEVIDPVTGQKVYAVLETGTFNSGTIDVPEFTAEKPSINPIESTFNLKEFNQQLQDALDAQIKAIEDEMIAQAVAQAETQYGYLKDINPGQYAALINEFKANAQQEADKYVAEHRKDFEREAFKNAPDGVLKSYHVSTKSTAFTATSSGVHESVVDVEKFGVECKLGMKLTIGESFLDVVKGVHLTGFQLSMPAGLDITSTAGTYKTIKNGDKYEGILDLSNEEIYVGKDGYELTITIKGIDTKMAGCTFVAGDKKSDKKGEFTFTGNFFVKDGEVGVYKSDFDLAHNKTVFDLPDHIDYICTPNMDAIKVKDLTGSIRYDIDNLDVDAVTLNDIPDALNDAETRIFLDNPQIYLSINNPLYEDGLSAKTSLRITPEKQGERRSAKEVSIELPGNVKDNVFCLSPSKPSKYYNDMNADYRQFADLRNIVALTDEEAKTLKNGGIPDKLNIDIVDPEVPTQKVEKFELGKTISQVVGDYTFYAPLTLGVGSLVVYKDEDTGWSDKTLDKLTITKLNVELTVSSDIPVKAELVAHPLDKNGNEMNGVVISKAVIDANAKDQHITLSLESGEVKELDGIKFRATLSTPDAAGSIGPDMSLQLKDIKATVSGKYNDKF